MARAARAMVMVTKRAMAMATTTQLSYVGLSQHMKVLPK
jgi:hypothetical protein